jgi:hypothetical protein
MMRRTQEDRSRGGAAVESVTVSYAYAKLDGSGPNRRAFWMGQVAGTSDELLTAAIEAARPQQKVLAIESFEVIG